MFINEIKIQQQRSAPAKKNFFSGFFLIFLNCHDCFYDSVLLFFLCLIHTVAIVFK